MESFEVVLSGWWRRVAAFLIDSAVLFAAYLLLAGLPLVWMYGQNSNAELWQLAPISVAIVTVLLIVTVLYTCLLPVRTNGQTLGKMALQIRVFKLDGTPVDFFTMFLRFPVMQLGPMVAANYLPLLNLLVVPYQFVDYLFPLWDARNQCVHDKVARTVVAYQGTKLSPGAKRLTLPADAPGPLPVQGLQGLDRPEFPQQPALQGFYPPTMGPNPAWCPDPNLKGVERLWDGKAWTDTYRGFLPDPADPERLRYFDGRVWTDLYL